MFSDTVVQDRICEDAVASCARPRYNARIMVDAFVQGMQAFPSRINPQSLHPVSFELLRDMRAAFIERRSAGPFVAEAVSDALEEVQRTQEEKFLAVMVEVVTVVFLAARDTRLGIEPVFRLIILGALTAMRNLSFTPERTERMLEQMVMAMFMTPAYEFTFVQYQRLVSLVERLRGELQLMHQFLGTFSPGLSCAIQQGLQEGLLNCLEIIEVDAVQKTELKKASDVPLGGYIGILDLLQDLWWFAPPGWYISLREGLERIGKKTEQK